MESGYGTVPELIVRMHPTTPIYVIRAITKPFPPPRVAKTALSKNNMYKSERKGHDSSVGIALGYGLDDRGSRVRFLAGLGISLFTTMSGTTLGPTQPPIQWVPGALSRRVKRPGCEADHSPPSSAEVKNAWNYTSTPPIRQREM
jgi:hypothetical protein